MRELHQFLFYLCRTYQAVELEGQEERDSAFHSWRQRDDNRMTPEIEQELEDVPIYTTDIGQNMFVSAIPNHKVGRTKKNLICSSA